MEFHQIVTKNQKIYNRKDDIERPQLTSYDLKRIRS